MELAARERRAGCPRSDTARARRQRLARWASLTGTRGYTSATRHPMGSGAQPTGKYPARDRDGRTQPLPGDPASVLRAGVRLTRGCHGRPPSRIRHRPRSGRRVLRLNLYHAHRTRVRFSYPEGARVAGRRRMVTTDCATVDYDSDESTRRAQLSCPAASASGTPAGT